jgi:hypothetical protein
MQSVACVPAIFKHWIQRHESTYWWWLCLSQHASQIQSRGSKPCVVGPAECWLTIRSTGPYTACRHLARHFILCQIPSRCSGPVSSNVRPHTETPLPISDPVSEFKRRLTRSWLPTYCHDHGRLYSEKGFRHESIDISPVDACDCMHAIDKGIVFDVGGGRFRAARSTATEPLFWEGLRSTLPRPITLWREPVITFASIARLNRDYGWPANLLGTQPLTWSFDFAAHDPLDATAYRILGEVKKSVQEVDSLCADLKRLANGVQDDRISDNSRKKWSGLLKLKAPIVWVVGPGAYSVVFKAFDFQEAAAKLQVTSLPALAHNAA